MKNSEPIERFKIRCENAEGKHVDSIVILSTEERINPTFFDPVAPILYGSSTEKELSIEGVCKTYIFEYTDIDRMTFKSESYRINNAFYGLMLKAEENRIKMLIKGCSLGYYMIPRLHHTTKTIKLILEQQIQKDSEKVSVFEEELNLGNFSTVVELKVYYDKWIKSIT